MKNIEKDTTLKKVLIYLLTKPVVLVLSREPKILDFLLLKVRKSQNHFFLASKANEIIFITYALAPKMGQIKISICFLIT